MDPGLHRGYDNAKILGLEPGVFRDLCVVAREIQFAATAKYAGRKNLLTALMGFAKEPRQDRCRSEFPLI
jgi:hypothetical protein